jgi:hypothetical protein
MRNRREISVMTGNQEAAFIQEPGIGGPVDLAGIKRYRVIRLVPMFVLFTLFGGIMLGAGYGLDWPARFPLRDEVPLKKLAGIVVVCGTFALAVPAGNTAENRLVYLLTLLSMGQALLGTFGCAAIFVMRNVTPLWGVPSVAPMLAGLGAALPLIAPPTYLAFCRYNRLFRATRVLLA